MRWSEVTFVPGQVYLQKRGTVANEAIEITVSGTSTQPIALGAYGAGTDPVIHGASPESGWTHAGLADKEVYQKTVNLAADEVLGNASEDGAMLRFVTWDTDADSTFSEAAFGSFAYDYATAKAYVWCSDDADPATHTIELSRRIHGISAESVSHVTVRDLHVRRFSLHGIVFKNSTDITVRNCTAEDLGGAVILTGPTIYAGNGIEFGNACANCVVESCTVTDIFDSGVSPQTYSNDMTADGFTFRDLTIERCGLAGIEIAVLATGTNCDIHNVTVSGNSILDCGLGWSGVRYGVEGRGMKIAADAGAGTMTGIRLKRNTISGCAGNGIYLHGDIDVVAVHRCAVYDNQLDGIEGSDAGDPTSLKMVLTSSLIRGNGGNGGANDRYGVSWNVPYGAGLDLYNNTFQDNGLINLALWNVNGFVGIRNNLFDSSRVMTHLYANVYVSGGDIDHNCYLENGGAIIHMDTVPGTPFATLANWRAGGSFAENSIGTADMGLAGDCTVRDGSPCIDNGAAGTGVTEDYGGEAFGNPPTIGAYEYSGTGGR